MHISENILLVCMRECMCARKCEHVRVCAHVYICVRECERVCACACVQACACALACACVRACECMSSIFIMHECARVHAWVCLQMHQRASVCVSMWAKLWVSDQVRVWSNVSVSVLKCEWARVKYECAWVECEWVRAEWEYFRAECMFECECIQIWVGLGVCLCVCSCVCTHKNVSAYARVCRQALWSVRNLHSNRKHNSGKTSEFKTVQSKKKLKFKVRLNIENL